MLVTFQRELPRDHRDGDVGVWYIHEDRLPMELGFIPAWVWRDVDMSFVDQIDAQYRHGGGWRDFDGFDVNPLSGDMAYTGDPVQKPIAMYKSEHEVLWMYDSGWVTVLDLNENETRTARID